MRRSLLVLTAAAAVLLPATAAQAAEGDIIVQREPGLDSRERSELRAEAGVKLVAPLSIERTELVKPKDGDVTEALAELNADDDVVFAEPDRRMTASTPNGAWWSYFWNLESSSDNDIDAPEAWKRSRGEGVTVAVVDTGINASHTDLQGRIADMPGWDFVSDDSEPQDDNGHGTHVAGTIAATGANDISAIGVAPEAQILPLRVLDAHGTGSMSDVAAAFDYAGDRGVRIVNASLGGGYGQLLERAVADHPGTLYVVAAGNEGADTDVAANASYPCALPEANIVCVGATDREDRPAQFSQDAATNYGATTVDLSAPGVDILSAWKGSPVARVITSGTSMATPHVAGTAALALAATPGATTSQLKWALMSSVDVNETLTGKSVSGGRLNADAAVAAITGDGPTPVPSPEPIATSITTPTPIVTAPPVTTPAPVVPAPVMPAPTVTPTPKLANPRLDVSVTGSLATKRSKLRVRFTLSGAATVRFTISRRGAKTPLAHWVKRGKAGANSIVITRKLPTGRTLMPGRYTLAVALNSGATTSRSIRVR